MLFSCFDVIDVVVACLRSPCFAAAAPAVDVATQEARLRQEMADLQVVRDRVAAMRRWLAGGGQLDPNDPMSADFEVMLASALADCNGDPMQLSTVLSERCVRGRSGNLMLTLPLATRGACLPACLPSRLFQ
jgi:hypothetical protein